MTTNNTTLYSRGRVTPFQVAGGAVEGAGPEFCDLELSQGTVVANGATPVTITDPAISKTSMIEFSLNTVGGTVGAIPTVQTITAGSCTIAATAGDTSTYNYLVKNIQSAPSQAA